ncbi:gluconate 2-dehydrogenase subunit 3 family protein [Pedobacter nutrimenti]|uniref:gluconate 2-dehydrogenase subunit 3 family protein n=1 Tax=Pedobacter nutrimenti TaxID=1241337 RepID=UPI002930DF4C|nr:gluconate 2-dehydrogenase subunit 3 family protein [Pedobacter nutrimenti]
MNRKKAIFRIFGVFVLAFSGTTIWKFFQLNKVPDLKNLEKNRKLIAEIAETIIPSGDSPGAKDVQVEDFIIKMVKDCTETRSQNSFMYGLEELKEYTTENFGKSFLQCNEKQRIIALTHFENKDDADHFVRKIRKKVMGDSFLMTIKNYTVIGYCSSELGATHGLAYDYIPSNFEACVPLKAGQRSWATK